MKSGYLTTSDNARIYYEERGKGEPILFVPGHMCTVRFFDKNAAELERYYRVIVMDPRGFGNSSKVLHGNSVARHAKDIGELITFLHLEQVTLLGWSMAGSAVVTYARQSESKHIKALGILDAALFPFSSGDWNSYAARDYNMEDWNEKYGMWVTDPERYYDNFLSRLSCGLNAEDLDMIRAEIKKTPPWIGYAIHTDWCHTDTEQYLDELTVPVFLAFGELTDGRSRMGRRYYEKLSSYRELHEFGNGGHIFFWADSRNFNLKLIEFIKKISMRERSVTG